MAVITNISGQGLYLGFIPPKGVFIRVGELFAIDLDVLRRSRRGANTAEDELMNCVRCGLVSVVDDDDTPVLGTYPDLESTEPESDDDDIRDPFYPPPGPVTPVIFDPVRLDPDPQELSRDDLERLSRLLDGRAKPAEPRLPKVAKPLPRRVIRDYQDDIRQTFGEFERREDETKDRL